MGSVWGTQFLLLLARKICEVALATELNRKLGKTYKPCAIVAIIPVSCL